MENNKITIDVEEYIELRQLKEEIKRGSFIEFYKDFYQEKTRYYSNDETLNRISSQNQIMKRQLDNFSNMSIFEFLRWKKKGVESK